MVSFLVPVYNEESVLPEFFNRMYTVLSSFDFAYEVLMINDGSTDKTLDLLLHEANKNRNVKIINLSRNFGHQIAITAGMHRASGDALIILDADLQDPPELAVKLIEKWREGYDVVYAIRRARKENICKRFAYFSFYRLIKLISDINIHLDSGDFCLMSRRVVDLLNSMPERNRFVRGIRSWVGFKQIGIEYERSKRYAGVSKYSLLKLFKLAFDGLISFSHKPLKIALNLGSVSLILAVFMIVYAFISRVFFSQSTPSGWTSLLIAVTFFGGVQLFTLGIIGEYIARIYDESKARPLYVIESEFNFPQL